MFKLFYLLLLILFNQSIQNQINDAIDFKKIIKESELNLNDIDFDKIDELNVLDLDENYFGSSSINQEPDLNFNPKEMIEHRGFKYEEHNTITQDCYILTMHRIVNPNDKTENKRPILLQHGLGDSSAGFIMNSIGGNINDQDDRSLGFALAKRGYDVWLGNYRGNTYSKNHTIYSAKDPNFWKFNHDNHALQDLSSQIAYIQSKTNFDQVGYIGHSQGTMTAFQLLAFKPEVAKAIKPLIALAPVAHVGGIHSPIRYLAPLGAEIRWIIRKNEEFLPTSNFNKKFLSKACTLFPGLICKNILGLITGFSINHLNNTRMPVYFNHFPAGTSWANIGHFAQNVKTKKFTMLDYMENWTNIQCYNSVSAPRIPLEKIVIEDLLLFDAKNDVLADVDDVKRLKRELKNAKYDSLTVEDPMFGHVDFLLSQKTDIYVNKYVFEYLEKRKPSMVVNENERIRLKTFDEKTCRLAPKSRCHMNFGDVLKSII